MTATAAGLNHLISFPKKVQVHFGQDNADKADNRLKWGTKHTFDGYEEGKSLYNGDVLNTEHKLSKTQLI